MAGKLGLSALINLFTGRQGKPITDSMFRTLIISLWREYKDIPDIVNVEINNSSSVINQSITQVISNHVGSAHESFLIESTTATTETVESSWSVLPYAEQVGEFKAVVMIRNKATDTIVTLISLLSFDYSEVPSAVQQNNLLTGSITLTVGVNGSNRLYAQLTGMPGDDKRIHFCFERCVLSQRPYPIAASGTFAFSGNAALMGTNLTDLQPAIAALSLQASARLEGLKELSASGNLILEGGAEFDSEPVNGFGLLYNGFITQEQPTEIKNGFLYNYPAATDSRNIAPAGWHVPTFSEVQSLVTYLGGQDVAGGKLKQTVTTNWNSPNVGSTNETGFNAIGSGLRYDFGSYDELKTGFHMWAIGIPYAGSAYTVGMFYSHDNFEYAAAPFKFGRSIRLLKDNDTLDTLTGNDGKVYQTVKIGNQVWMAENLMETKYRNGDDIPESIWDWSIKTEGARCSYNNIESNAGSTKKLSSSDNWVVPTTLMYKSLLDHIDIYDSENDYWPIAGNKLRKVGYTHWNIPNINATDEFGFSLVGSGIRSLYGFDQLKAIARILTSDYYTDSVGALYADCDEELVELGAVPILYGCSIRLCNPNTLLSEGQSGTYTQNDGTVLKTIVINGIEWLAENLKETMWRDGTLINLVEDSTEWSELEDPAYCYVNGNPNTM